MHELADDRRARSAAPARTRACGSRSTPPTPRAARCMHGRGARHRDQQRAPLLRARVGRARRRARRRAARRRPARVLPALPRARPAATARTCSASPRRHPHREVGHRRAARGCGCSTSSCRRSPSTSTATTVDASRQGSSRLHVARPRRARAAAAEAVTDGLAPGPAHARVRVQHAARRQVDRRPPAPLRRAGSRAATSPTRRATSRCRRSSTRCRRRYDIPQRWYALKAQLLGLDRLADYDRMASVGQRRRASSAGTRRATLVLDAYASFSPELADVAQRFFDESWIDAPVRPGKRPGAFCAYTVPSHHPYLLLNWTVAPARRAHARARARSRPARVPRARAGRLPPDHAAHAGRDRVGVRRDGHVRPPARRRPTDPDGAARAARREPRGPDRDRVPPDRDEPLRGRGAHRSGASEGELSVERFGELWADTQTAMLGDSVEITEGYRTWWSYIPHFIGTPGYVYAYAYGQLLALSVYRAVRGAAATTSCRSTSSCSRPAGRGRPRSSARSSASTSPTPGSGTAASTSSAEQLEAAEAAAKAAGRL